MTEMLALPPEISSAQAWNVVASQLPGATTLSIAQDHHPFTGLVWDVTYRRRRLRGASRIHTLVDSLGGSAFVSPPWPSPQPLDPDRVDRLDCSRCRVSDAHARDTARRAAATTVMRKVKLGRTFDLVESEFYGPLWKPNWRVVARWKGLQVCVLVDGLDGSHYVIQSSPSTTSNHPKLTGRSSH